MITILWCQERVFGAIWLASLFSQRAMLLQKAKIHYGLFNFLQKKHFGLAKETSIFHFLYENVRNLFPVCHRCTKFVLGDHNYLEYVFSRKMLLTASYLFGTKLKENFAFFRLSFGFRSEQNSVKTSLIFFWKVAFLLENTKCFGRSTAS